MPRSIGATAAALTLVILSVGSPAARAATFYCEADANAYLGVEGNGWLYTGVSNGSAKIITGICNLTSTVGDVTPQACSAWYAMLLTQRSVGGKALPHFDTADPSNTAISGCADLKSWEHHAAYYIPAQ